LSISSQAIAQSLGFKGAQLHDIRYAHATILLARKIDKGLEGTPTEEQTEVRQENIGKMPANLP